MINKESLTLYLARMQRYIAKERLLENEPMRQHTTFAVGGPADILVLPTSIEEIVLAVRYAREFNLPLTILGGGSNVLVLDGGIRGIVIQLQNMKATLQCQEKLVIASAGFMLADVCQFAQKNGLGGASFSCGIPGTIGGAVFMNAGAYEGEMSQIVSHVRTVNEKGEVCSYDATACAFSYRHSRFQETNEIIVEVELALKKEDPLVIQQRMDELMKRRRSKQPLEMASAGSTFKRPQGHFAGTLIDHAGLKGLTYGGAQVSTKHAGFVVNTGKATAQDVLTVIRMVQERVASVHGVQLETEVRILGEA